MPKIITTYKRGCYLPLSSQFKRFAIVSILGTLLAIVTYLYIVYYLG